MSPPSHKEDWSIQPQCQQDEFQNQVVYQENLHHFITSAYLAHHRRLWSRHNSRQRIRSLVHRNSLEGSQHSSLHYNSQCTQRMHKILKRNDKESESVLRCHGQGERGWQAVRGDWAARSSVPTNTYLLHAWISKTSNNKKNTYFCYMYNTIHNGHTEWFDAFIAILIVHFT